MIRLLAVDDSALMRRLMRQLFTADVGFVLEVARDDGEALDRLIAFAPDVVALGGATPRLDGLACLARIMAARPCPVVMIAAPGENGTEAAQAAFDLGAVDVVAKPEGVVSLHWATFGPLLLQRVRAAAQAMPRARPWSASPQPLADMPFARAVVVGASTGGPPALDALLAPLPATFPWPILVAQHMPAGFTAALARRLDGFCALGVEEVREPVAIACGHVYVARGDADLIVARRPGGPVALPVAASPRHRWHPSVARLAQSALDALGAPRLVGVLLTGMGDDGAEAMARLRAEGGHVIAEAEASAVVWGMPGRLAALGGADDLLPVEAIAARLQALAGA